VECELRHLGLVHLSALATRPNSGLSYRACVSPVHLRQANRAISSENHHRRWCKGQARKGQMPKAVDPLVPSLQATLILAGLGVSPDPDLPPGTSQRSAWICRRALCQKHRAPVHTIQATARTNNKSFTER